MPPTTLIILGALPASSIAPAPLRISRWADLVRARPEAEGWPTAALLAAHAALLHRIPRVILADPGALRPADLGALRSLAEDDAPVLDADGSAHRGETASTLADLGDARLLIAPPTHGARPRAPCVVVHGRAAFTPPGAPRAFELEGALVAPALLLGTARTLGPQVLLRAAPSGAAADNLLGAGAMVLEADLRGAVRLRRPLSPPPPPPPALPLPGRAPAGAARETAPGRVEAARRDDAIAIASLRGPLQALTDSHAFARGTVGDTRSSLLRGARVILDAAVAGGRIAAYSLEVLDEGGQLALDVRVRAPRRVHAVSLRLTPLDAPRH